MQKAIVYSQLKEHTGKIEGLIPMAESCNLPKFQIDVLKSVIRDLRNVEKCFKDEVTKK